MLMRICGHLCLMVGFAVALGATADATEPRVALIIGNSNYGSSIGKLLNPANDAKLMADTLGDLGFSVDLVLDADQKAMKRAIKSFGAKLEASGKDATGLFYYAGHGVQVDGQNFLLPVGAEIEREADVEIESISADDVMTQMQYAGNRVNLVFLDACRNNPLARTTRSATRGLARLDAPRGSFVGYSTAPGDVAADGDGANSPYALALAEGLRTPGISVEEAHRNVRAKVLAASGNKQTPWDSSSLTGPVILAAKAAEPPPQPAAQMAPQPQIQQQAAVNMEVVFWESIKSSVDPADFEAYLTQYPRGAFVPLARNKIAALKTATAPQQAVTEEVGASASNTGQPSKRIVVSPGLQEEIADYLKKAAAQHRWGALAIATDGGKVGTAFCNKEGVKVQICIDGIRNMPTTQAQTNKAAIIDCGGAGKCVLLYEGVVKRSSVEIVSQIGAAAPATKAATAPGDAAPSATASIAGPEGTFKVTPDVMEEIETYLSNLDSSERVWAFAVAKDGTDYGKASCGAGSTRQYCWASKHGGTAQSRAENEAVKQCGGVGSCILLYSGARKRISAEIVTQ